MDVEGEEVAYCWFCKGSPHPEGECVASPLTIVWDLGKGWYLHSKKTGDVPLELVQHILYFTYQLYCTSNSPLLLCTVSKRPVSRSPQLYDRNF